MSDTSYLAGATSKIVTVRAFTASSGAPKIDIVYNTAGLAGTYTRDAATATTLTLVTATAGTYTSSGFVHRGGGVYEVGAPTAALAAGADGVEFAFSGVTDCVITTCRVELLGTDPRSSTIPDVNVTKIASQTASAAGAVTFPATLASSTNITAGTITTVTTVTNGVILAADAVDSVALAASAATEIANATVATAVDGTITLKQILQLIAAACAGKLSGAATTTVSIRNVSDTVNAVVATVDADGNRSATTYVLT